MAELLEEPSHRTHMEDEKRDHDLESDAGDHQTPVDLATVVGKQESDAENERDAEQTVKTFHVQGVGWLSSATLLEADDEHKSGGSRSRRGYSVSVIGYWAQPRCETGPSRYPQQPITKKGLSPSSPYSPSTSPGLPRT